jgi:hypothetical protein
MSDTPKHTLGPWEYHKMPQSGYIVFQTWDVPTAGYVKTEADAQLIAAAPEMLEALKYLTKEVDACVNNAWLCKQAKYKEALDAIAKAEGRHV